MGRRRRRRSRYFCWTGRGKNALLLLHVREGVVVKEVVGARTLLLP